MGVLLLVIAVVLPVVTGLATHNFLDAILAGISYAVLLIVAGIVMVPLIQYGRRRGSGK